MKKLFVFLFVAVLSIASCDTFDDSLIWDKLNNHEDRIKTIETWCKQVNTNIASLQTALSALQSNDYVTNVVEVTEAGEVIGYTLTFAKNGNVTIYHGKDGAPGQDGATGQDGKDGHTPVVGVKMDADGIYYWTLDGEWLLNDEGEKIPVTGKDGQDGEDGEEGIAPQLKIEDNYWYVSYDNGVTWIRLYKAVGEDGKDGSAGDSFIKKVDTSNSEYIIITLVDGSQMKFPTWKAFEDLQTLLTQINTNVESLQAIVNALQNKDYVTSVTPITENGVTIGYTIYFSQSGSVNIYHGTDGVDGETPVIGVSMDNDGVYYWTINGKWLLDASGNKVKAVGIDGENGATGAPGVDGITPQFNIEDGKWFISYDDGATWADLGQATGDQGPQGVPGKDGDAFFQSVTQDKDCVYLTLADGTVITIPRHPADAVELTLGVVTGYTATFNGTVNRHSLDLKVTVYYSTNSGLTVYKHTGEKSFTDFNGDTFSLKLTNLTAQTKFYYFIETVSNGVTSYSDVLSFTTGTPDSYVDWGEGENVEDEI